MKRWLSRVGMLAVVLALVIGVLPVQAQGGDMTPTVRVQTQDGNISVLVPDGWFFYDNTGDQQLALFTSMLFFGESEREIEARLNINRGVEDRVNGFGGVIALVDSALYQQAFGVAPNAVDLMQLLIDSNVNIGATVSETTDVQIMGSPGKLVIINTANINNEVSIAVTFETNLGVVAATSSGPLATFDANVNALGSILDTIVIPASAASSGNQGPGIGGDNNNGNTGQGPGLGGDNQPPASETKVVASSTGEISIEIPTGWIVDDRMGTDDRLFVFGDSQQAVDSRAQDFLESSTAPVVGTGGYIALLAYDAIPISSPAPDGFARLVLESMATSFQEEGGELLADIQDAPTGLNSAFVPFKDASGEYGVLTINAYDNVSQIGLIFVSSDDGDYFFANAEFFGQVVGTVSAPAQPPTNNATPPNNNGVPGLPGLGDAGSSLPGLPGMGNQPPAVELGLSVFNAERTFAFDMPSEWQISETSLPAGFTSILYFGTDTASINGFSNNSNQSAAGAYFLQPRGNIDRNGGMDVEQLFNAVFANATFTTITTQRGLVNGVPAYWAEGTLAGVHGYWALVDFDSQVAVFILTTPEAKWAADEPYLSAIFNSARFNPQGLQ